MTIVITLLGTGSPMPNPDRAGPATLVTTGEGAETRHHLIDAGRGVLMRLAALGLGAPDLAAVFITHLHSDHITDLNDVITTRWVMAPQPTPLTVYGPVGTRSMVDHLLASLEPDIGYRIAHHDDLDVGPAIAVVEVSDGPIEVPGAPASSRIRCAPTDHKPVEPSIGYRFESCDATDATDAADGPGVVAVVVAGDTVPCAGLDALCAGADALIHTVIRKDVIANIPLQRMQDTLDYHSSPEQAGETAARAGVGTLVLTHYVPAIPTGGDGADWRARAAEHFGGIIELGDDLHRVVVTSRRAAVVATPMTTP